ncbi:hypothetical protein [Rhodobacter sp. NSM]|uniref:hypothetical protein n=1 Tax=Rhodobacter sp. NSM TaxID=3457501 RepID=UPI003FD63203
MLKVNRAPAPADFRGKVTTPGLRAIAEMIGKGTAGKSYERTHGKSYKKIADNASDIPPEKFPPYWREALTDLMKSYNETCAYICMRIHPVTGGGSVDHFAAKSASWRRAYQWGNYRLCCSRINSKKNNFSDVVDPFLAAPDSFQLELLTFQVKPSDDLDPAERTKVDETIRRLGLNDFCRDREAHAEDYWDNQISLKVLRRESPFVAYELYRQNKLKPGDNW